jgi:hypothetical protein
VSRKRLPPDSPDRILEIATGFQLSKILFAAVEFDIFGTLGRRGFTVGEIASTCKLPVRPLQRLLNGAAFLGLIRFRNGKYYNSLLSTRYLIRGKPEYLGDLVRAYNLMLYGRWKRLEEIIREDTFDPIMRPKGDTRASVPIDPEIARRAMMAQQNYSVKPAEELARKFDFSKHRMLLDLGGGTGILSIMAAKGNRKLKAIVFDIPPVCRIAEEIIVKYGLSGRVKTCPGNILEDSFPSGADVIVISGVLDGHSEESCREIIRKGYAYLPPGGAIILKEAIVHDDRMGPMFPVVFSLSLLIETQGGDARSRREMTQWLREAGFRKITYKPLTALSGTFRNMGMLTAVK